MHGLGGMVMCSHCGHDHVQRLGGMVMCSLNSVQTAHIRVLCLSRRTGKLIEVNRPMEEHVSICARGAWLGSILFACGLHGYVWR